MLVTFRQWGGFGGLPRGCELDTSSLAPREGKILRNLVEECAFAAPPLKGPAEARDTVSYEIVVEEEGERRSLAFDDLSVPPSAGPLLDFLRERSRPREA